MLSKMSTVGPKTSLMPQTHNVTTSPKPNYTVNGNNHSSLEDLDFGMDFTWKDFDYPDLAMPQETQAALITIYVFTSFLAIFGNLMVIVVLSSGNRCRTVLSRYLINLAVADGLMAVFCIPFTFTKAMMGRWMFGSITCPLIMFLQILSVAVGILTNAAVAIDRLVAVSCPMKQRYTKTRTNVVILIIWTLGVGISVVQLVVGRTKAFYYDGQYYDQCSEQWNNTRHRMAYTLVLFVFTYIFPLTLIACAYAFVIRALWRRRIPGNENARRDSLQLISKRKVTKMLITLVLVFAVCWLPIHIFNIVIDFAPWVLVSIRTSWQEQLYFGLFYCCHWLAMSNSFANPVIYFFMNDSFRADLKYICRRTPCHPYLASVTDRFLTSQNVSLARQGSYIIASSKHLVSKHSTSSNSSGCQKSRGTAKTILSLKETVKKGSDGEADIELNDQLLDETTATIHPNVTEPAYPGTTL